MKQALRLVASLALSAVFLYLASRGVDWSVVRGALGDARLVYVAASVLGGLASICFRAVRWGVLVGALRSVRFRSLFSATSIGFAANMLLPLRAGELLRPWLLAKRERIPFAQAMATAALERLFDMATLVLLFSVATLTLPLPPEWRRYGWFFLGTFVVFLAVLFVMSRTPRAVLGPLEVLLRPAPQRLAVAVLRLSREFAEGLAGLGSARAVALAILGSLAVWASIAASFGFGLSALALDVPWVRASLTVTTFVAIAVAVPGGPGFVGMFQLGCVVGLAVYGVPKSIAFGYSVLVHVIQFAGCVLLGLYFFLRDGLSLREMWEWRAEAQGQAGPTVEARANVGSPR